MGKEKLSKDIWVQAGFQSLAETGPKALNVNALAVRLGATKGSFYWHFKDLGSFQAEMLDLWRSKVASEIIADVMAETDPVARLDVLMANAARVAPDEYGGRRIEPAIRAWALSDPVVAEALQQIDALRIGFLTALFTELSLPAAMADLTYGAYIGLDDLRAKGGADPKAAYDALKAMLLAARA